ncbi:pyridoxal phosphate-dependent transferase [Chaetomium fimeti]|uniref:Pyridoxal phosphate-dependent transferase n=1 Tax=Chaetomium fimeti TaxID=1854472 RepID=A0AAE0HLI3_9PEZI|nr:pyridoxal phosphate-dependent transferase [Chaetomium fimeti]
MALLVTIVTPYRGLLHPAIRPGATKLISICSPNNPTGTKCSASELQSLASLAKDAGCCLLIDETYVDLDYASWDHGDQAKATVLGGAELGSHVITVSSMSKADGVPGIRVGWPHRHGPRSHGEQFLAAKEQISISGSG